MRPIAQGRNLMSIGLLALCQLLPTLTAGSIASVVSVGPVHIGTCTGTGCYFPPTSATVGAVVSRRFLPEYRTTHGEGMAGRFKRWVSATPGADPVRPRGVLLAASLQGSRRAKLTLLLPPVASSMY